MEFSITHHVVVVTAELLLLCLLLKTAMICNLGNLFTFSELKKKVHSPLLLCYTKNMGCLQKKSFERFDFCKWCWKSYLLWSSSKASSTAHQQLNNMRCELEIGVVDRAAAWAYFAKTNCITAALPLSIISCQRSNDMQHEFSIFWNNLPNWRRNKRMVSSLRVPLAEKYKNKKLV